MIQYSFLNELYPMDTRRYIKKENFEEESVNSEFSDRPVLKNPDKSPKVCSKENDNEKQIYLLQKTNLLLMILIFLQFILVIKSF